MKHDAALFIAEAVDQFSELCLTGRRQFKMRRGGGARHPRSGFPGASNDTVCLVKTAPSGSTSSINTLCGPRCSPTRMRVLLWPESDHDHGRSSTVMCKCRRRHDNLSAADTPNGMMRKFSTRYGMYTTVCANGPGSGASTVNSGASSLSIGTTVL